MVGAIPPKTKHHETLRVNLNFTHQFSIFFSARPSNLSGMSTGNTPIGFGIYDLLTRVTPGAVFLLIFFGSIAVTTPVSAGQYTSIHLIAFAVLSLIIGEAINHIAGILFVPPTSFRRFLHEQDVDVKLGRLDRWRRRLPKVSEGRSYVGTVAGDDFWALFTSHFRLDDDYSDAWDIYNLLLGYMQPKLSPRTRRQQTIFRFVNNTALAIFAGVFFILGRALQGFIFGDISDITIVWSVLITFLAIFVFYALTVLFGYQESQYVSNLLTEYYIDRAESGDVDDLESVSIQTTLDRNQSDA